MNTVFADTLYWAAGLNKHDQWHDAVVRAEAALGAFRIITTEAVLTETLNFYAEHESYWRQAAASLIRRALANPKVEVIAQTNEIFMAGLQLYEARPDKGYSLTDCISMNAMRERDINEILTHDHHFAQEGFVILL